MLNDIARQLAGRIDIKLNADAVAIVEQSYRIGVRRKRRVAGPQPHGGQHIGAVWAQIGQDMPILRREHGEQLQPDGRIDARCLAPELIEFDQAVITVSLAGMRIQITLQHQAQLASMKTLGRTIGLFSLDFVRFAHRDGLLAGF